MPVIDIQHDLETMTLTIHAEFAAPIERIWALYADPRQLEKVFGPPTYPATFVQHSLEVGSHTQYYMTSPEGQKFYGAWTLLTVDEPDSFSFEDGFADADFVIDPTMPVSKNTYAFETIPGGTRATYTSRYASAEALQRVLDMGMIEGATQSINQIDAFLA